MRRFWMAVVGAACLAAAGCPGGCDPRNVLDPTRNSVQSVTVSPDSASMIVGQTRQFTATVLPESVSNRAVTWSVAPSAAGTIDANGVLTAIAPGQAVVTATSVGTPVHTAQAAVNIVSTSEK